MLSQKQEHGFAGFQREALQSRTLPFDCSSGARIFSARCPFNFFFSFFLYLPTRRIFVSASLSGGHYLGAADLLTLLQVGVIRNVTRQDYPNPSLHWNWIQCPVLWHRKVACCWEARMFNRQRTGEKFPAFHPFQSCRVSHSFQNMVIFMIKMLGSARASRKTSCGILRDIPNINTNRINSHARGVSGIHFKLALNLGSRFPRDCPCWKCLVNKAGLGCPQSINSLKLIH